MKILRVEKGEHDLVYTDAKPKEASIYRRNFINGKFPTFSWEHWLGDTHQWLRLFDDTQLEEAYDQWIREQKKS